MKKELLHRPFPPEQIKQRQGQHGKMLNYLETHVVIARLNEACDAWSFEIIRHDVLENEVIVVGKLIADGIVKMAFGTAEIARGRDGQPLSIGDSLKAGASDALKKSASLLGVGLHLYADAAPRASTPAQSAGTSTDPAGTTPRRIAAEERITTKQLGAVQSVARRKNIDRNELAAQLGERFGKNELQLLSKREASAFLSELLEANGAARV